MMILKAKYGFAIAALLFSSSMYLYDTTGKSECFWFILGSMTLGSLVGTTLYFLSAYWGNKFFNKLTINRQ
jgi:membrane protein DedA with SNARE-associated domain